ncbi:Histone deacetylase complex subunit SAP18 [Lasiodiplodia hormozganensis]|uniref:Histone deacetylase complex subunit SAP18 n=2 Tax=Lasiodiplodia TaxID=66739 RepID=A0A5N5CV57_9PEZI|nr:Histone deacetylase complex subunit SAP18 [Lasiodiplodia theobromae]KAK0622177.1 Histone deacetylase complex subunit SAP18 [Lasiodiplodia hormozganensis]
MSGPAKVDRQTTTPFLLKLFYRSNAFHRLDEFSPHSSAPPPPHLQIYTWPTCSLRELTHLLVSALPSLLPDPAIGTRLAFRLIFPDTRSGGGGGGAAGAGGGGPGGPGRYLSKELGSVIVGGGGPGVDDDDAAAPAATTTATNGRGALDRLEGDADKTLADARFVIGDYVSCCILPPGADGSVATGPPPASRYPASRDYGMSRGGPPPRENGYGDRSYGGGYGRRGGGPRYEGGGRLGGGGGVPPGEWRRGEIPSGGPPSGGYGRGRGGRGPRPY